MPAKKKILNILSKRILILDGATGTELQKRGMPPGYNPEAWALKNPELLKEVHSEYKFAGADIVYTSTFGANPFKLAKYKLQDKVFKINKELAHIARRAVGKDILVAGDLGPSGIFVEPWGVLGFEELVYSYKQQVKGLLAAGVDLFVIETMMDIQEARAALLAVKELTDKFVMVTLTYDKYGRTLNGTDSLSALVTLQSLGADAVGCNCSTGPQEMAKLIKLMKPYATVPLIAKPNAGIPRLVNGKTFFSQKSPEFVRHCRELISAGANIIGGCCGTSPEYIRQLSRVLKNKKPQVSRRKSLSALASARKSVFINEEKKVVIVGERINPTGKKVLQKELLKSNLSLVLQMAKEQEKAGAMILDVNLSVAGADEQKLIRKAIGLLARSTSLPLVIDSPDPATVECAARIYPGRILINSISCDKKKAPKLLRIASKYGAMFILLPISEKEIPHTFNKRKRIIMRLFSEAKKFGFTKDDIIIDGLVMSVSSHPAAAKEILKTIFWSQNIFKANTIVGLSNISFGMPDRRLLNRMFLRLAVSRGLKLAIADPLDRDLMKARCGRTLIERAGDIKRFIVYCQNMAKVGARSKKILDNQANLSLPEQIKQSVIEGDSDGIIPLLNKAISLGLTVQGLVSELLAPAITRVGELYDKREYFLPQLIASAETMKKAIEYLEPYLKDNLTHQATKGLIVMATVKGDIHDIGKNIVVLMLRNHGFKVVDLGKDVSNSRIIRAVEKNQPVILGLSALMTTTMVRMQEVIGLVKSKHFKCGFMVGGAVLNDKYASTLGAYYAPDAVAAVRIAEKMKREISTG